MNNFWQNCRRTALVLVALVCLTGFLEAQRGARVLPRALDQLTTEAEVIVQGSVVSAQVEPHPQLRNLMTVAVTFRVDDTLKGSPVRTLHFRQYIWDIRDQADAAGYFKGQELLLMLGPSSSIELRSPVGLEQGRFRILRDRSGSLMAVNGRGNQGLFEASVSQRAKKQGLQLSNKTSSLLHQPPGASLPLADLKEAIRNFAGTK